MFQRLFKECEDSSWRKCIFGDKVGEFVGPADNTDEVWHVNFVNDEFCGVVGLVAYKKTVANGAWRCDGARGLLENGVAWVAGSGGSS